MRAIILAAALCSFAIGDAVGIAPQEQEPKAEPPPSPAASPAASPAEGPDTRGDASRRQLCLRHPNLYWCEEGPPFIANPKPPAHNGFCLRWPADPFCRDERR